MKACVGTLALALCAVPVLGAAQQNPIADAFRSMEQRHAKNITAAAEEMPADKYGYKPTPAQMSFGDVIAHLIEDGNDNLCGAASGQKAPTPKFTGADPKDKLVAGLKESFQFCETALASIQDAQLGDSVPFFGGRKVTRGVRSEEHTSELQSLAYLVCRLLLEKKKQPQCTRPSR